MKMKIGDLVIPRKKSGFTLHCGCGAYVYAIVVSVEPFILTSEDADMLWSTTIKPKYFKVIGKATKRALARGLYRVKKDREIGVI